MANQAAKLLSVAAALEIVVEQAHKRLLNGGPGKTQVETQVENIFDNLLGRIVAEDLYSAIDVPGFANSAMDGYVFNIEDLHWNNDRTQSQLIPIAGEVAAGQEPPPLPPGTCFRIFTGAPVPERGNLVVPQENCIASEAGVRIQGSGHNSAGLPQEGDHIRAKNLIFSQGQQICRAGSQCNAELLSVLASAGISQVPLYRKLRLGLCITGDELASPGQPLRYGQIYDSNQVFLSAISRAMACDLVAVEHLADDYQATQKAMIDMSRQADVIICSGGVSVGDKDFVQRVMHEEAQLFIRKVAIKPGKPFTFGELRGCPVFCLPGNPLSVYICWQYFVVPFLQIVQGIPVFSDGHYLPKTISVPAPQSFSRNQRTQFLFARLDNSRHSSPHSSSCNGSSCHGGNSDKENGVLQLVAEQSSAALQNLIQANGALIVPANSEIQQGDILEFFPF